MTLHSSNSLLLLQNSGGKQRGRRVRHRWDPILVQIARELTYIGLTEGEIFQIHTTLFVSYVADQCGSE